MKQKRCNLNSETYLFEEAFSGVVVLVVTSGNAIRKVELFASTLSQRQQTREHACAT